MSIDAKDVKLALSLVKFPTRVGSQVAMIVCLSH